ncbi:hypothetical protein Pmar_PMAR013244 [Perkinsus marinus ATCC 50983]|uniref:Uncharacterized protein n=1 Tax=Perkinsus marinus (strain ATCC 50983 / TXsc) TaxID=423536 RepID=C5LEV3_PERM5|nr:hypothetical protein Pmar_PMAR013244 [Perkinsus marinus ATCC 50983]EER04719.1 hypothetical protein Pmar_PMAR013244 [Perkinsus marinus ATCC 50983]|eukprot:XP_002772903.1 hypothetical protein Pmar_PMAR013244 [Perkinsus marinus ATCC 50983]
MDALSPSGVDPAQTTEADNSTIEAGKDSATSSGGGRKTVQVEGGPSLRTVTTVVTAASRASRRSVKPVTPVLKRRHSGGQGEAPKVNVSMKGTVTQQLPAEVVGNRKQIGGRPESKTESEGNLSAPKSSTSYSVESSAKRLIEGSGMMNSGKLTRQSTIPMRPNGPQ